MQVPNTDKSKNCGVITDAKKLGDGGEAIACRYLELQGFRIKERNVRYGRGEIDIIAEDRKERMIVFVEVKTRASHSDAYPIHSAMDRRKRRALRKTVARWVVANNYEGPARIDVLSVHQGVVVEHLYDLGSDFY